MPRRLALPALRRPGKVPTMGECLQAYLPHLPPLNTKQVQLYRWMMYLAEGPLEQVDGGKFDRIFGEFAEQLGSASRHTAERKAVELKPYDPYDPYDPHALCHFTAAW